MQILLAGTPLIQLELTKVSEGSRNLPTRIYSIPRARTRDMDEFDITFIFNNQEIRNCF